MSDTHTEYFRNYIKEFDTMKKTFDNQSEKYDIITRKLISLLFYISNVEKEWFEINDTHRSFRNTINLKLEEFLSTLEANKEKIFPDNLKMLKKKVLEFKF